MDVCIRPSSIDRRQRTLSGFALAVFLIFGMSGKDATAARGSADAPAALSAYVEHATDQYVSIENTTIGQEAVTLSARLSDDSVSVVEAMHWIITDLTGDVVVDGKAGELQAQIPPGEYKVAANYGFKHIEEPLTVMPGSKLNISYILNTGALRILPRIKGTVGIDVISLSRVFSLHGSISGKLVTTSSTPGEVLMMPAGSYRIESRFADGNAVAVTDIKIRPGIMSAVDIEHIAGLVVLDASEATATGSMWIVKSSDGTKVLESRSNNATLVLQPGTYTATMMTPFLRRDKTFEVKAGEHRAIALGH